MLPIPDDIWEQYVAVLKKRAVPVSRHADYSENGSGIILISEAIVYALSLYFEILRNGHDLFKERALKICEFYPRSLLTKTIISKRTISF